jgi:periplasmic divalent cation tolerance protein
VEQHLAASVNITGPMTSMYRWQGKIETAEEWQCLMKTTRERYAEIELLIHNLHSYELPGIIVLPITGGKPAYLNWIDQETQEGISPQREDVKEALSKSQLIQKLADAHEQLIEVATLAHQRGMICNDDGWGPREILAHIAGWETMAAVRIPKIVAGIPPISYVNEEQHAASDDNTNATVIAMIGQQSFDDIRQILRDAYQRDIQMLNELDESLFHPNNYVYKRTIAAINHCNDRKQGLEQ